MPSPKSFTLDVRPLIAQGEDPFSTIRTKVDSLASEESLEVIAPFLPAPLIELLKAEGFTVTIEHHSDSSWSAHFRR